MVDIRIGAYLIIVKLWRSSTQSPLGTIVVQTLGGKDMTDEFVHTNGQDIPASSENLRKILNMVYNSQNKEQ